MDLTGAAAIVTGGAGGFGAATTRRLVAAGAKVLIADLAEERAQELVAELGSKLRFHKTDVTSEDSVAGAIAAAADLGPPRVAVIVHGNGPTAGARVVNREGKSYSFDVFKRTVDIFLTGTFNVLSQAAVQMATNEPLDSDQRGAVITTASIAGLEGAPGQTDYSAAKGGLSG